MVVAAVVATVLLAIVAVFQVALAAGAPLGAAAWGGQHDGVLPRRLRIASGVVGLVVYPLIIAVVLSAAGLVGEGRASPSPVVLWVLAVFFALGGVLNAVSRSAPERIWAPVSLGVAACCAVIASSM